jgi:DNA segregation ATPase FtsK/SpoIIIE-like protein
MSYKVASQVDSRTILDMPGAEDLLGRGDALYLPQNGELKRVHGSYVPDDGIAKLLEPHRCKIEPLKLKLPETASSTAVTKTADGKVVKKKEGFFRRCLNWWSSLRVREQKTIVRWFKYFLAFAISVFAAKKGANIPYQITDERTTKRKTKSTKRRY